MLKDKKCLKHEELSLLSLKGIMEFMKELKDWSLENSHLVKHFVFSNFSDNMSFVNKIAELAEKEGHHPSFSVNYNALRVELWTRAVKGLSENDFILAAKIDALG